MFLQGLLHPDLLLGIACLIPKAANITMASQIQPILLLEVVQKVYASILMRRLAHHWPPITAQLGAVPGGQPIEALFAAQHMIALATVTDKQPLFLKLDIKGAFDNLRHASVAAFLATLPAPACYESMRLLSLLLEQKIHLSFLHDHWELHTSNGTPQGGSHSAGLFARTLDHAIGQLLRTWEAAGHSPVFPPLWLLLFVDDILLCFRGWVQAIRLLPSFLECLSTLGLEVNYAKSCLVLSPALRSSPPPSPSLELLKRFPWVENTQYLRKPFGYRLEVDAVHHQQSLQLIYGACGKLKPVLKRCHWTNPLSTSRLLDQYVGSAFLWLSPALHPYQQFRHKLRVVQTTLLIEALNLYIPAVSDNIAHQLLRFRRHIVKRWILHMTPSGSWDQQYLCRYWSFLGHICRQDYCSHRPAKIMLHHVIGQHAQKLNRPGPWHTPHSLVSKFWRETGLDGDYIHIASDREAWKSLTPCFLNWQDVPLLRYNVEFLDAQPWDHPKHLLRMQIAWLQVVFIHVSAGLLTAVWLDQAAGFCVWTSAGSSLDLGSVLCGGMDDLCSHLCMLGRPFVLQVVVPHASCWRSVTANRDSLRETLVRSRYASWYQFFPLNTSQCKHSSLRQCFTHFVQPNLAL